MAWLKTAADASTRGLLMMRQVTMMGGGSLRISSAQAARSCGSCTAGGNPDDWAAVPDDVAKKVGTFSRRVVARPAFPPSTQELLARFHASVKQQGADYLTSRWGFEGGQPKEGRYLDPQYLPDGVSLNLQKEGETTKAGKTTGTAFRQICRFTIAFSNQMCAADFTRARKATQTVFGCSETEAAEFVDMLKDMTQEFRAHNDIGEFDPVNVNVNGLTQYVSGDVREGEVLLQPHRDGRSADSVQSTFLYRGPEGTDPLHKVVITPEVGGAVEVATGPVIFNGDLHHVVARRDGVTGELSATIAIGFEQASYRPGRPL